MKKHSPLLLFGFILLITFNLWVFSKPFEVFQNTPFLILISQLGALIGFILMSVSFFLATRVRFLESMFGGLDKLYKHHKYIGSLSFIFLILHPVLLFTNALPQIDIAGQYILPSLSFTYNLGVYSLYAMIFSFIFIVFVKLPYNIWRWSHRLLGISFFLASIHAFTIGSDIGNYLPLQVWIFLFAALGLTSFVYILIFYPRFGPRHEFEVKKIDRVKDILNIYLRANKTFKYKPGQFVYITFEGKGIPKELHPFSLASSPSESLFRISAKIVGDYTLKLNSLKIGDKGVMYGPYGSFADKFNLNESKTLVWIAGGIGITPFLGMLRDEFTKKSSREIYFYYCCRDKDEAVFDEEVGQIADKCSNVNYTLWCSNEKSRITARDILSSFGNVRDAAVQICGPKTMMETLEQQFVRLGVAPENIRFEDFATV